MAARSDDVQELPEGDGHLGESGGGGVDPVIQAVSDWGTIDQVDILGYVAVIACAVHVHIDRERVRRGLWKDYTAKDQLNQVKVKIDRILRTMEILEEEEDPDLCGQLIESMCSEAFDIINYTVFGVRQLEGTV